MSQQQSYATMTLGFPGMRMGSRHHASSYINDLGSSRQIVDITISAVNSTAYNFTINGILIQYTSDGTATAAEIRDGLIAAGRAIPSLEGIVSFQPFGALIRVIAAVPGTAFTYSESPADGNLTPATTVANVAPAEIPFGRAVVKRLTGSNLGDQSSRLPFAPTAQIDTVTVAAATNATQYELVVRMLTGPRAGATYTARYLSDGSATTAEVAAGLAADLALSGASAVTATYTSGATFTITAVDVNSTFAVEEASGEFSDATTTAAVVNLFLGVAERNHNVVDAQNASTGVGTFRAYSAIDWGDMVVEVEGTVAVGDPAYYRHTASGANTDLGKWRNTGDTNTAALVPNAMFVSSITGAGLAVLRLK